MMKLKYSIAFCGIAFGLVAARAQDPKANAPEPSNAQPAVSAATPLPAPAQPAFTNEQVLEELGWMYGKRMGLSELGFTKTELAAMIQGMTSAADGKDSPYAVDKIEPEISALMQKKQTDYMTKLKQKNAADNAAFFAKLKENKNVVELPDGLCYEIVKPGAGAFPKPSDSVKVHYTGTLLDGTVFDSSVQRGQPADFVLKDVIPGWTEGIQKINKGGKIRLYVPPQLAYGEQGNQHIPPGATLIFDVELLDINPPGANAPAANPTPAAAEPPPGK